MKFLNNAFVRAWQVVCLMGVLIPMSSWAVQPFALRDIRVEGLQRTEPGTVFASLPFRIGDTFTDDKGSAAIRALFGLGLFADVGLQVEGDVLVITLQERPLVADVTFSGIKEFDAEVLKKALRDIGLAEGRAFDKSIADRAEQELKRQYLNRSMYAAQVVTTVTPAPSNRVSLNFSVVEGNVAEIQSIRIVGAQAVSERTLRDLFNLDTGGWLTWYTKANRYSRAKLNADLETLRSYYLSNGFLEFRIDSTQVAISPGKSEMELIVNITEGNRFVVSAVEFEGDFLGKDDEFKSLVAIRVGQPYNDEDVAQTIKAFTDHFAKFGYAFAQVQAAPRFDRNSNRVMFVLQAQPKRRVYVRKINVAGNNKTRDEVLRREFRQLEAAWYDGERIRRSRDRVDRLGFFTEVSVETEPVPGTNDQVDLTFTVVEKPTGNLSLGAGYSQSEKLSLVAGIRQENVFGTGNYLALDINTSDFNEQAVLSTTNPYFTADGVSRSLDLSYTTNSPLNTQGEGYRLVTPRAAVRFGVPIGESDTLFLGAGAEQTTIEINTLAGLPVAYQSYTQQFGKTSTAVPLTLGWGRDSRDSALVPSEGRLQRLNAELSVAGDVRYLKTSYQFQQYIALSKKYTLAFNTEFGLGSGSGGKDFPLFKNFYGGGLGSVRGFEQGSFGGRSKTLDASGVETTDTINLGGDRKIQFNAEFITPFPGAGNDRTLRLFGFYDLGTVLGVDNGVRQAFTSDELRSSVGIGLSWISPVGPLRFAWAKPILKKEGDRLQSFQFQIGTSF
ncbi:MAG: outer membrane protein assembly factor BamA [Pseudomonadota bacterium]|jgi:outer membrane protein insertion porin family